jgi:hypothetical protein
VIGVFITVFGCWAFSLILVYDIGRKRGWLAGYAHREFELLEQCAPSAAATNQLPEDRK